jgi:sulfide:quinone oxidoreductase
VTTRAQPQQDPLRVVIAGGGVAALEALIALRRLAEERVSIELLSAEPQFWYRPLAVAEPFEETEVHGFDLSTAAEEHGATVILGALAAVDAEASIARTAAGGELPYDALLVAVGADATDAVPGAITFRGPAGADAIRTLIAEIESNRVHRVAFALPAATAWPLPLYELALQTAATDAEVVLVTNEEAPLDLFGHDVSKRMTKMLNDLGIELVTSSYAVSFHDRRLVLAPDGEVAADRVVALPRLVGPQIAGLPHDSNGFIPTDPDGRVAGLVDVFAAGDVTTFPIKQGGLATQQADAAAEAIAALAGAPIQPTPFRPVLRGLIITGGQPLFARTALTSAAQHPVASGDALWWPPAKIAGRYLAPYLAERAGSIIMPPVDSSGIAVDVALPTV